MPVPTPTSQPFARCGDSATVATVDAAPPRTAAAPIVEPTPLQTAVAGKPYKMLDAWRGIACLWVLLFHASEGVVHVRPEARSLPQYALGMFGYLGVQLFFVISGYCIANAACLTLIKERSSVSFTAARLRRIFPPMWISLLLYAAFNTIGLLAIQRGLWTANGSIQDIRHWGPSYWIANLTLTQPWFGKPYLSGVCWTLTYEVSFYGIVALLVLAARIVRSRRGILLLMHLLTIASLLLLLCRPERAFAPLDLWPQFGFGVLVYDLLSSRPSGLTKVACAAIFSEAIAFVITRDLSIGLLQQPSRITFAAAFVFAAILLVLYRHDSSVAAWKPVRAFIWLGTFSYSLYLTHFLTLTFNHQVFKILHQSGSIHARWAAGIVLAVFVGWGFYALAERPFLSKRPARRAPKTGGAPVAALAPPASALQAFGTF